MKIEDVFKKLKPLAIKDMDLLWQEYILADPPTQRSIEESMRLILAKNLDEIYEEKNILLEPPPKEIAAGEYPLGSVFYGKDRFHSFGLREDEWIQHLGIFGRSGSGKSNIGFIIFLNLLNKRKPVFIFDWKRNYRELIPVLPDKEILVFTVGRSLAPFHFNPLIPPPGSPPKIWLKKIIEITQHAYYLGEGVAYLLQKAIDSVYQEFGVYDGNSGTYPNLNDVKNWLEKYRARGREAAWMDSAQRAVGVLCFGEVGNVLNHRTNFPIKELLNQNVILELDALTNSDKIFFIESLLLWIHHFRMAEGKREQFKHAIIIKEAHHVLLRRKQEAMGEEAVTDVILREIRELGEAIILIDQHPSLISKPALGNTYCTIAMNLKHRSDIAKRAPMRIDSSFYMGTISQSMLATVVFMLEEEGRLGLDNPISDIVEFPGGAAVTVEMLLDHSSGFADWTGRDLAATGNPGLPELLKTPLTIGSLMKIAAAGKPAFPPGERQEACYTNMLLLTKLIENIEGKPASTVLAKRIFKPLDMKNTRYLKTGEELRSLAVGYRAEKGWGQPLEGGLTEVSWADDNLRALADQGIVSTAGDVLKYHIGLRKGKLISPESWEKMRTVRPGKINGLGYLVMKGAHGTWEGNTGHAVGHLSINLFHVDRGFYLVVMGNLGDAGLPVAKLYNIRYGN
jgi:CubicO group peptidase (beta-lactamase class C family)